MANCKDCLHYQVCGYVMDMSDDEIEEPNAENDCQHFARDAAPVVTHWMPLPEQRWIPVTERLPDTIPRGAGMAYSEAVNVLTTGRTVLTAVWDGMNFIADAKFWEADGEEITHWASIPLPLPEPPKEDK